jgi:hypothetical protein
MRQVLGVMCLVGAILTAPNVAPLRFGYVIGIVDSIEFLRLIDRQAPSTLVVDSPSSRLVALIDRCLGQRMTREQVVEIVDKYVRDHPGEWHYQMPDLVLSALRAACSP